MTSSTQRGEVSGTCMQKQNKTNNPKTSELHEQLNMVVVVETEILGHFSLHKLTCGQQKNQFGLMIIFPSFMALISMY